MINIKNSPTGIDVYIQRLQQYLYDKLKVLWPVDDTTLEGYGRVYRNANDKGYVPELFVSSGAENNTIYKPVYFDKTTLNAMFFFDDEDKQVVKGMTTTALISVIFIVNLKMIKPQLMHRGDEEARQDVRLLCSTKSFQMEFVGEEKGFKNVFIRFDGLSNKDGEVFEDRHPIHCFKMNLRLNYNPNRNC